MIEMKAITLNFFTFGGVSNPATVNGFHISHSSQSFIHPQGMQDFFGASRLSTNGCSLGGVCIAWIAEKDVF